MLCLFLIFKHFFICINHPPHHNNIEPSTQIILTYITYTLHNYGRKKISYLRQYSAGHHYRNIRFTAFSNTVTNFNLFYFNTFRIRAKQYRIFGFQYFLFGKKSLSNFKNENTTTADDNRYRLKICSFKYRCSIPSQSSGDGTPFAFARRCHLLPTNVCACC